jgi:subtilisin family serine protease
MSEGIRVLIERSIVSEGEELPTLGIGEQDYALEVNGFSQDTSYGSVKLGYRGDRVRKIKESATLDIQHRKKTSYLVRGQVEDNVALDNLIEAVEKDRNSIAVFTDPAIKTFCESSEDIIGCHLDVAEKLLYQRLQEEGFNGSGVFVGIVDTGFNLNFLRNRGLDPDFSSVLSSTSNPSLVPGNVPTQSFHHGTMCAFNVCHAATRCTLIDSAVVHGSSDNATALVSDVIKVYGDMSDWIQGFELEGKNKPSLVINNSWGIGHWRDFPNVRAIGIDNENHPFNLQIQDLEESGADILFAAGNGGSETIYGSNSHPQALCVGGVRIDNQQRLSYSSQGPGFLQDQKPDLCTYAHFLGSEARNSQTADMGTSTACAVASGIVAAIRTLFPPSILSPAQLRQILCNTARHPNSNDSGYFDYNYGYGLINVEGVLEALRQLGVLQQT